MAVENALRASQLPIRCGEPEGNRYIVRIAARKSGTPVEDAAGAGRQTGLPKVKSVEPSVVSSSLWLVSLRGRLTFDNIRV